MIWPMSFPAWIACRRCGVNHVEWVDAVPIDTDDEYGVRHRECPK